MLALLEYSHKALRTYRSRGSDSFDRFCASLPHKVIPDSDGFSQFVRAFETGSLKLHEGIASRPRGRLDVLL